MASDQLFYKSINAKASRTLLLLHGAVSSHREWDLVSEHLPMYHLLIPDLPSHGRSTSASIPLELPKTVSLLKDLVTKHAKGEKADMVGMSLGGYIAIYIAQKYPEIVGDLFISGVGQSWPTAGTWTSSAYGTFMGFSSWTSMNLPKSAFNWITQRMGLKVNDELYLDGQSCAGYALGHYVVQFLGEAGEENWKVRCERVKARTCVVAGILDDKEKACAERGEQLRVGNSESQAFKLEGKRHAWDLQDPELFASGIKCWMEHEDLPAEYVQL